MSGFTPGVYPEVPESEYHARKFGPAESLSSTEAKLLLKAPALLAHRRANPPAPNKNFDLGHVVHSLVLGEGLPLHIHDWKDLRTAAAKADVAEARENGMVPIKRVEYEEMRACADSVLTHSVAGALFTEGTPELSMYAKDTATGVWMRGRIDWAHKLGNGDAVLVDLKTSRSAHPAEFNRQAASLDYALQREWYRTMWERLTGQKDPRFLHVVVEKTSPYLVSVCEMTVEYEEIGRLKMRQALDLYKECTDLGAWPGIDPTVHAILPPAYYMAELEDLESEIDI